MDNTTAGVVVLGIIALVFISFFAVFRRSGKGKIKGPFGTGLEVEGSNEPMQTYNNQSKAGLDIEIRQANVQERSEISAKVVQEPAQENPPSITLKEISDRINAAPPFQQDDMMMHFVGLTIDWKTRLASVAKEDETDFYVTLSVDDEDDRFVGICSCKVAIKKYPELKILLHNHPIRVVGKIAQMRDVYSVNLEEAKLVFSSTSKPL